MPVLMLGGLGWLIKRWGVITPRPLDLALGGALAPLLAGAISGAILLVVWRSLNAPQPIHDEQAYVLQAQIFAHGRWTGEPPPIPEFFEQTHVFVEPRLAAKYPPGNSLLLVPGVWVGLIGLMPLVFTVAAGGLVFAIARRLTDPWIATLTWALWSTSTAGLFWRASYYSQNADTVLWLLSMWALLEWRAHNKPWSLIVVACAFAWMYLTRPLTAVALAAPVAVIVMVTASRRKLFKQVVLAVAVAMPVLLLNPLWHERTLGDWRTNPYTEYSRQYMPFEKPGFGLDRTPAVRSATLPHVWIGKMFMPIHEQHRLAALPVILPARIAALGFALAERWRVGLLILFVAGAIRARGATGVALISFVCLVLAHLVYAHPAQWTLYYVEVFPVFFFIAACELVRISRSLFKGNERSVRAAILLGLILMARWFSDDVLRARDGSDMRNRFQYQAGSILATLPPAPAVVFVDYPPNHWHSNSLVGNTPDYRTAHAWMVYDRGEDNDRLLRITDRAAYRLKTADWTLERLR